MGNSGNLLSLSDLYAKIYFLGAPFVSVTNFAIAIIHASVDTKTPMKILLSTGLLHIILNLIFVLIFNMSVDGMAFATITSNFISAVVLLRHINKIKQKNL